MSALAVNKKKQRQPVVSPDVTLVLEFLNQEPKRIGDSAFAYLHHKGMLAIRQELGVALGMMLSAAPLMPREWTTKERIEAREIDETYPEDTSKLGLIQLMQLLNRNAKLRWRVINGSFVREDFRSPVLQAVARLWETGKICSIVACVVCAKFFVKSRSEKKACKACQKTYESWQKTDYQAQGREFERQCLERERQRISKLISKNQLK